MSTYSEITRHPLSGQYFVAEWKDDYFGPHKYGVKFPGDEVVYPSDQVHSAQLKTFWAADIMDAMREIGKLGDNDENQTILAFLGVLQDKYRDRWKRDPEGGEGAVAWKRSICDEPED